VYSNYALKGLDSKVGPEMRSTGEGIALASTVEKALKKVFHPTLKKMPKHEMKVVVKTTEDLEAIYKVAEQVQLSVKMADNNTVESLLKDKRTVAFYNPTNLKEDKLSRELATRNRIITFTQKESLEAFIT
ncbi:carbamoyl-phosphate synthase large subunit, partial [Paenibacillus elgii]|nr:carbamoyl-phosphate synthase large subunit [Paenibacillus elgii]